MELTIQNLCVEAHGKQILKGLSLTIRPGEIHAVMGPNGAGKSTLAKVLAGHPSYEVTSGDILVNGESILELEPAERAHKGIFMGFQYPVEIPGVTNLEFLLAAYNAHRKAKGFEPTSEEVFEQHALDMMKKLKVPESFLRRDVNGSFSGGEKKRNEILQMGLLEPEIAVLDETDSGLDIDAMKIVAEGVNAQMDGTRSLLLITHYQRLLDYITPHFVHVVRDGEVVKSGDASLALQLETKGYDWL